MAVLMPVSRTLMKQVTRVLAVALLAGSAPLLAQSVPVRDLGRATLEDLMNITVTTATRTSEGAAGAPARVPEVTSGQIPRPRYRVASGSLIDAIPPYVWLPARTPSPSSLHLCNRCSGAISSTAALT